LGDIPDCACFGVFSDVRRTEVTSGSPWGARSGRREAAGTGVAWGPEGCREALRGPVAGLTGMSKLLFVDAGLYAYLAIRPLGGIGFDFRLRRSDVAIGLREFAFYTPIALGLGFALSFLHFHRTRGSPAAFGAGWLFTLFFVAMPEELFFRGMMLNMLERRIGTGRALAVTSAVFGLAHFNKRAAYFNWRYVILAAVAGVFYGRAWLAKRRLISSSITHATVDTVWSIWLR